MIPPISNDASDTVRAEQYAEILRNLRSGTQRSDDWIAVLATAACELHHAFSYFHWTGFYRVVRPRVLMVGPYQGTHGCTEISFDRGVCGAAARTQSTQFVPDVHACADHIACAATTNAEVVVPIVVDGRVVAVLDVDSDIPAAFTDADQTGLEAVCAWLSDCARARAADR